MPLQMLLLVDSLVLSGNPPGSANGLSPRFESPSRVRPAQAALGELAAVLEISGVGDRRAKLSCIKMWGGKGRGSDGEDVLVSVAVDD